MQAVEDDPTFAKKVGQIIILGGAFSVNGNVNPAAEANVRCMNLLYLLCPRDWLWFCGVSYSGKKPMVSLCCICGLIQRFTGL
jgi:hypothetical protein